MPADALWTDIVGVVSSCIRQPIGPLKGRKWLLLFQIADAFVDCGRPLVCNQPNLPRQIEGAPLKILESLFKLWYGGGRVLPHLVLCLEHILLQIGIIIALLHPTSYVS